MKTAMKNYNNSELQSHCKKCLNSDNKNSKTFDGKLVKTNLKNNTQKIMFQLIKINGFISITAAQVQTPNVRKWCIKIKGWRRRHSDGWVLHVLKCTENAKLKNILKNSICLPKNSFALKNRHFWLIIYIIIFFDCPFDIWLF